MMDESGPFEQSSTFIAGTGHNAPAGRFHPLSLHQTGGVG